MWQAFVFAFNAIMPMLILMAIGYFFKERGVFDPDTIKKMNYFAFKMGISIMAFNNVYKLRDLRDIPVKFMLVNLFILFALTIIGMVLAQLFMKDNKQRGVLVQCAFRSNYNVVGISMAEQIGGAAAAVVTATMMAPTVLYYNIVAVIVLTLYGQGGIGGISLKGLIRSVTHNSIIIGLTAGLMCLVVRALLPVGADGTPIFLLSRDALWLYGAIRELARMASPMLLIFLGATVTFSKLGDIKKLLAQCVTMRLLLAPLVGFALFFGAAQMGLVAFDKANVATMMGVLATPCPIVGAAMAADAGCDEELAGQAIVWSTVLSMLSMMLIVMMFRMNGFL